MEKLSAYRRAELWSCVYWHSLKVAEYATLQQFKSASMHAEELQECLKTMKAYDDAVLAKQNKVELSVSPCASPW